jgi:Tol biopolymer transport system component
VAADGYPTWSPDGEYVAYRRLVFSSQGPPGIYIIRSDGSENRLLLDETSFYGQGLVLLQEIRFSPNGRQITVTKDLEVYLLDVLTGSFSQLTHTGQNAAHPDWSPDGKRIVYNRAFYRSAELDSSGFYIVDVETGQERALFNDGKRVAGNQLRWSPEGEPIAFSTTAEDEDGYPDIYTIQSNGTGLGSLTAGSRESFSEIPHWIDDGTRILYAWTSLVGDGCRETRVMDADGSNQRTWPLLLHPLTLISDSISPNSQEIVVPSLLPNSPDSLAVLFIRDLDDLEGTTLRQLTSYFPASQDTISTIGGADGGGKP